MRKAYEDAQLLWNRAHDLWTEEFTWADRLVFIAFGVAWLSVFLFVIGVFRK